MCVRSFWCYFRGHISLQRLVSSFGNQGHLPILSSIKKRGFHSKVVYSCVEVNSSICVNGVHNIITSVCALIFVIFPRSYLIPTTSKIVLLTGSRFQNYWLSSNTSFDYHTTWMYPCTKNNSSIYIWHNWLGHRRNQCVCAHCGSIPEVISHSND